MSTAADQNKDDTPQHFTNIASKYHEDPLFQSPSSPHRQWLSTIVFNVLNLTDDHILVDVGCGSGLDCLWLLDKMNKKIKIVASDPSSGMIQIFNNEIKKRNLTNIVEAFCMDAVTFSQQKQQTTYNRILLKFCIHLLSHEERLLAFNGFHQQLNCNDNKLVIVTRPGKEIFPLDKRTQEMFASVPSIETYIEELTISGYTNIKCDIYPYTFDDTVKLNDWINLIQKRVWSIFSSEKINEQQMIDLISYLKQTYQHQQFQLKDEIYILHCTKK